MRHGITELNKKKIVNGQIDEPLATEGTKQVRDMISLIPESLKHIYTSPLLRARQTADIINSGLNCSISICSELREINMGSLAGMSWEDMESGVELKKKHRGVKFDYRQQGGESVEDVKNRINVFLKKIKEKHDNHEVLVITHGGIIRVLHFLEEGKAVYKTEKHTSLLMFDLDRIIGYHDT